MEKAFWAACMGAFFLGCAPGPGDGPEFVITVSFPETAGESPLDGRLLLLLSDDPSAEPRFQVDAGLNTQMVFGMDVEGLAPGRDIRFDQTAPGFLTSAWQGFLQGNTRCRPCCTYTKPLTCLRAIP